jgi:hypothetical protein
MSLLTSRVPSISCFGGELKSGGYALEEDDLTLACILFDHASSVLVIAQPDEFRNDVADLRRSIRGIQFEQPLLVGNTRCVLLRLSPGTD